MVAEETDNNSIPKISREFVTRHRVIYADTDKMAVVYHAKYLEYFEIARNELLREIGFPYKFLEENDVYLPIIEVHLKYSRPAQYDDLLTIKSVVSQDPYKFLRFKIACNVYSEDGTLLTSGYTVHIISNSQGRPVRAPKEIQTPLFKALFNE